MIENKLTLNRRTIGQPLGAANRDLMLPAHSGTHLFYPYFLFPPYRSITGSILLYWPSCNYALLHGNDRYKLIKVTVQD